MAHYGALRDYRFSGDVDDIRGANLYGRDDDKLGTIKDVIFDHATGTIQYAVVDTGGWLNTKEFLVPADRIHSYDKDDDDFAIDATKQQIEALPKYDDDSVKNDTQWNEYDRKYREAWAAAPFCTRKAVRIPSRPRPVSCPPAPVRESTTKPTHQNVSRENFPRRPPIPASCVCVRQA